MSEALYNRRYKDSVFVDLFREDEKAKENVLPLYNALHGTSVYRVELRVFAAAKTSLLHGTTAVHGGSENAFCKEAV